MTAFDPKAAATIYAGLDTSDLANIAYIDENYLPDAKELAVRELKNRGALTDKAALIEEARRELAFRREAAEQVGDGRHHQMARLREKTMAFMMVPGLWGFALIAPTAVAEDVTSMGWTGALLAGFWLFHVIRAVRSYTTDGRRLLVYIVVVPAILSVVGWIFRLGM